jgi:hypothetical protein
MGADARQHLFGARPHGVSMGGRVASQRDRVANSILPPQVYSLFRGFAGFRFSTLWNRKFSVVAFATFDTEVCLRAPNASAPRTLYVPDAAAECGSFASLRV